MLATDLKQHFDVLGEFNSHLADVHEGVLVDEGGSKTYTCAMKVRIGGGVRYARMDPEKP